MSSDIVTGPGRPLVRLAGLGRSFPGVRALDDVTLEFRAGEIHSVIGENGAGKSTLVKLLAGLLVPDAGEILIGGAPALLRTPARSRRAGISYVPQEPELVPVLSVGRNVLLGREGLWTSRGSLSRSERATVLEALERVGVTGLDPDTPATALTVAEARLCQIAGTLIRPGSLIILDEPTAVLSDSDAETLLHGLTVLRDGGTSILYISHRLGEVQRLSDRISILRDGSLVGSYRRGEIDRSEMLALMARSTGEPARRPAKDHAPATVGDGEALLRVDGLTLDGTFEDVGFEVHPGQVVGVAGIQGSGHGRLLDVLAGFTSPTRGTISVAGENLAGGSLRQALRAGVRLVPEDRRHRGIVGVRSVLENLAIGYGPASDGAFLRRPRRERGRAIQVIRDLDVRAAGAGVRAGDLSGGNQQKVVIGRALGDRSRVLLLTEPTQGIDVRSKTEILGMLRRVARERGIAVVLASCEFDELLEFADVIHVMRLGRISATMATGTATYGQVLDAAIP